MRSILRNDHQVSVRDAVAMHYHPDALRLEVHPHPPAYSLGNYHHVRGKGIVDVREVINVLARDNRALAGRERPKRHECQAEFVLANQTDRRAAGNDLAENARRSHLGLHNAVVKLRANRIKASEASIL